MNEPTLRPRPVLNKKKTHITLIQPKRSSQASIWTWQFNVRMSCPSEKKCSPKSGHNNLIYTPHVIRGHETLLYRKIHRITAGLRHGIVGHSSATLRISNSLPLQSNFHWRSPCTVCCCPPLNRRLTIATSTREFSRGERSTEGPRSKLQPILDGRFGGRKTVITTPINNYYDNYQNY